MTGKMRIPAQGAEKEVARRGDMRIRRGEWRAKKEAAPPEREPAKEYSFLIETRNIHGAKRGLWEFVPQAGLDTQINGSNASYMEKLFWRRRQRVKHTPPGFDTWLFRLGIVSTLLAGVTVTERNIQKKWL